MSNIVGWPRASPLLSAVIQYLGGRERGWGVAGLFLIRRVSVSCLFVSATVSEGQGSHIIFVIFPVFFYCSEFQVRLAGGNRSDKTLRNVLINLMMTSSINEVHSED